MTDLSINWATPILGEVNQHYQLPFQPRPKQLDAIMQLALSPREGWYADPGTGKTLMSTVVALYKRIQDPNLVTIVMMPYPILIPGWLRWLRSIGGIGKIVDYRGSPKQREALDLSGAQFIVMTTVIFKKDYERLQRDLHGLPLCGIVDEAHCVKNVGSLTYKAVRDFFPAENLLLLTGTPLTTPGDAYAYVKLISPSIYRSQAHFENIHVADRDFFGKVTKWANLELLRDNFLNNSVRLLKEEMLQDLKEPVYTMIEYDLDPKHKKLYDQMMDEQLLELDDGGKIDATTANRLYHAAQQIVVNYDHFSGDPKARSAAFDIVEMVLNELGITKDAAASSDPFASRRRKLIIFAQYKMTNRKLVQELEPYGAVAVYGEISRKAQDEAIERFLTDPACQIMVAHAGSAGFGWNPQEVCSDVLFIEEPILPREFIQAVGRVYRDGQKETPVIRIAVANGTIQQHLHRRLLDKDSLVNEVQPAFKDLRDAIHGQ